MIDKNFSAIFDVEEIRYNVLCLGHLFIIVHAKLMIQMKNIWIHLSERDLLIFRKSDSQMSIYGNPIDNLIHNITW